MNPRQVLSDLEYVDDVAASKQKYHVYQGDQYYVLLTIIRSKSSCNLNILPTKTVDYVRKTFGGRKKLTARQLMDESKRSKHISERFDALTALYVICALGEAKIDNRYQERSLYFNLLKQR